MNPRFTPLSPMMTSKRPYQLNTHVSDRDFPNLLHVSGKWKQRSDTTHDRDHAPLLAEKPIKPIWCLLLGDSMLEHLKSAGVDTEIAKSQFPKVFNAGVGGDKIQNVPYPSEASNPLPGP